MDFYFVLFKLVPKLNTVIMAELETVLGNKPVRAPMVSTLALRWQTMVPATAGAEEELSPTKRDESPTESKQNKMPFCTVQWRYYPDGGDT